MRVLGVRCQVDVSSVEAVEGWQDLLKHGVGPSLPEFMEQTDLDDYVSELQNMYR
jgi:hypothetical protein